jgi:hypothetical protein
MPTFARHLVHNQLAYQNDTSSMTTPTYLPPTSHHAAGHVAAPIFVVIEKRRLSTSSGHADGHFTIQARRNNGVGTGA